MLLRGRVGREAFFELTHVDTVADLRERPVCGGGAADGGSDSDMGCWEMVYWLRLLLAAGTKSLIDSSLSQ